MSSCAKFLVTLLTVGCFTTMAHAGTAMEPSDICDDPTAPSAVEACTGLIARGRHSPQFLASLYLSRANAHSAAKHYDLAIQDLDQSIQIAPKDNVALFTRGVVLLAAGQPDRAIADFDQLIERNPHFPLAHQHRGRAFLAKNLPDRAIEDFDQAVRLNPADAMALHQRAAVHRAQGRQAQAAADNEAARKLDPKLAALSAPPAPKAVAMPAPASAASALAAPALAASAPVVASAVAPAAVATMPASPPAVVPPPQPVAAPGKPGWIADAATGCRLWNWDMGPKVSVTWSGECHKGLAHGQGIVQWFTDGKPDDRYEGAYIAGKRQGRGEYRWANGDHYLGGYLVDAPNGIGFLRTSNGTHGGIWVYGCLNNGNLLVALEVEASACGANNPAQPRLTQRTTRSQAQ